MPSHVEDGDGQMGNEQRKVDHLTDVNLIKAFSQWDRDCSLRHRQPGRDRAVYQHNLAFIGLTLADYDMAMGQPMRVFA
jgi:hypothetical protein